MWRRLAHSMTPTSVGRHLHSAHLPRRPGRGRLSWGLTLWLVGLWLAVFGSVSWTAVLGGVLVALVVQWLLPLPHVRGRWRVHPWALVVFLVRFLVDAMRAGVQVAWVVLRGRPVANAIVRVDLRSGEAVHMTIISAVTSLIPGTIVVRIDRLTAGLYLHVLDVEGQGGVAAVRAAVAAEEERLLRAVVPAEVGDPWGPEVGRGGPR